MRSKKIFSLLLMLFFLVGCIAYVQREKASDRYNDYTDIPDFFKVTREPIVIQLKEKGNKRELFREFSFSFESQFKTEFPKNDIIKGSFYVPRQIRHKELFIVLPASGDNTSAEVISQKIVVAGFYVTRIQSGFNAMPEKILKEAAAMPDAKSAVSVASLFAEFALRQRIIDLMRLLDYCEKAHSVEKAHVVGISLGGIIASLYDAVDPRVKSQALIISSARIARILMDSQAEDIKEIREMIIGKYHVSYEEAFGLLEEHLKNVEPTTYASRVDTRKVLLVNGRFDMLGIIDTAIPLSAVKETVECFRYPERIVLLFTGHVSSYLAILPFWIEIPTIHHIFLTPLLLQSYISHVLEYHFYPKLRKH